MKFLIVFALLLLPFLSKSQSNNAVRIIYPSEWFGLIQDSVFYEGEEFYGIYETLDDSISSVKIFNGRDSVFNSASIGPYRGVISDSLLPGFLIKGLELKDGLLIQGKFYENMMVFPGQKLRFEFNEKTYLLFASGKVKLSEKGINPFSGIEGYKLVLRSLQDQKEDQVIAFGDFNAWGMGGFEGGIYIKWIGDLNNDSLIDILFTHSTDYKYKEYIFMMGIEDSTKQIQEVARYGFSGS